MYHSLQQIVKRIAALTATAGNCALCSSPGLTEDAVPVGHDAQQMTGQHDDLGGLVRAIEVHLPVRLWVLVRPHRSSEEGRARLALAGRNSLIGKCAALGLERLPHQIDADVRRLQVGGLTHMIDESEGRLLLLKPSFGSPCNGCGYCCATEACVIAREHIPTTQRRGPASPWNARATALSAA